MSGGVGGGGREADPYPDFGAPGMGVDVGVEGVVRRAPRGESEPQRASNRESGVKEAGNEAAVQ
jgi:hypothetical protein